MQRFLIRIAVNAMAFWVASLVISGFILEEDSWKIVLVVMIFGVVNVIVRPVAKLLSLPLIILTLGLFTLIVNAVMLVITDWLTVSLEIDDLGSAAWAAVVITLVSWVLNTLVPDRTLWTE